MTGKKHRANCDHHDKLAELEAWLLRWKDKGSQDGPGARQDKDDEHDTKKNEDGGTGSAMAVANLKVPKAPKNPVAGLEEDPMAHLLKEFECVCVCVCVCLCVLRMWICLVMWS
ncbi:MAG: hypothetical protein CME32_16215, partial [Gimesia sp.]|nr:hypothetical protein [Gimesia sp.]